MKKNGFTLIELLAIIVILAIIAVITVPIILNIIENAKEGAATDSAYGYKDAIDKFYVSKLSIDSGYNIPDGLHTLSDFDAMGVTVSGKKPSENSFLKTFKNKITQGCLQYDEYKVEFVDGKPLDAQKGTCKTVDVAYVDTNENGLIDLGDTFKIENEEFYILDKPYLGKVKLLPKYNLNYSSRQASSNVINDFFASNNKDKLYWEYYLGTSPYIRDEYLDIYSYAYVHDERNWMYSYFENYKNYLISLGATFVTDARAMSKEEAQKTGCTTSNGSCPLWLSNQDYWLGTLSGGGEWIYIIESGKNINSKRYYERSGYRPIIEIYESAITDKYTIKFDSRGGSNVDSKIVVAGTTLGTLPSTPTRTGATFLGWYTNKDYTGEQVTSDTVPIGSVSYYAKWSLTKVDYVDSDKSGTVNLGDSVKIMDEEFYVLTEPSNGKVKLLPKYNLNYSSRQTDFRPINNLFANPNSNQYWLYYTGTSPHVRDEFAQNNDYAYVYDNRNNMYSYFENYKNYLISLGATYVSDARAMSKQEALNTGCTSSSNSCPSWLSNQNYWLGTIDGYTYLYTIDSTGNIYYGNYNSGSGYRPLIEINDSAL